MNCEVCGAVIPFENLFSHFASEHTRYDPLENISVLLDDKTMVVLIANTLVRAANLINRQFCELGIYFNPDIQTDDDRSEVMVSVQWTPLNRPYYRIPIDQVPGLPAMLLNLNPSSFRPQRSLSSIVEFIVRLLSRISNGIQNISS